MAIDRKHLARASDYWYDGVTLPPVGCECKVLHREQFVPAKILAHGKHGGKSHAVCQTEGYILLREATQCRPLRSPEDCARDDLVGLCRSFKGETDMRIVADAIWAAGYQKTTPLEDLKAKAFKNPAVQAEYDRIVAAEPQTQPSTEAGPQPDREREKVVNAAVKALEPRFGSPRAAYVAYCRHLYDVKRLKGLHND
jgi:hypothetical protein